MTNIKYKEYIRSKEWSKKRRACIGYGGKRCFICGKRKKLHCHHKTYKNLGNENVPTELFMVCPHHHLMIHQKSKSESISIWEATERLKKEFDKSNGIRWSIRDTADYNRESRRLEKIGL